MLIYKLRSLIKRQASGTASDNEWYNEWQRVVQRVATSGITSDNEWQRMTTSGTTSDIEWREVTSGKFGRTSFLQIIWCCYESFFISLRQRLLQAVVGKAQALSEWKGKTEKWSKNLFHTMQMHFFVSKLLRLLRN